MLSKKPQPYVIYDDLHEVEITSQQEEFEQKLLMEESLDFAKNNPQLTHYEVFANYIHLAARNYNLDNKIKPKWREEFFSKLEPKFRNPLQSSPLFKEKYFYGQIMCILRSFTNSAMWFEPEYKKAYSLKFINLIETYYKISGEPKSNLLTDEEENDVEVVRRDEEDFKVPFTTIVPIIEPRPPRTQFKKKPESNGMLSYMFYLIECIIIAGGMKARDSIVLIASLIPFSHFWETQYSNVEISEIGDFILNSNSGSIEEESPENGGTLSSANITQVNLDNFNAVTVLPSNSYNPKGYYNGVRSRDNRWGIKLFNEVIPLMAGADVAYLDDYKNHESSPKDQEEIDRGSDPFFKLPPNGQRDWVMLTRAMALAIYKDVVKEVEKQEAADRELQLPPERSGL